MQNSARCRFMNYEFWWQMPVIKFLTLSLFLTLETLRLCSLSTKFWNQSNLNYNINMYSDGWNIISYHLIPFYCITSLNNVYHITNHWKFSSSLRAARPCSPAALFLNLSCIREATSCICSLFGNFCSSALRWEDIPRSDCWRFRDPGLGGAGLLSAAAPLTVFSLIRLIRSLIIVFCLVSSWVVLTYNMKAGNMEFCFHLLQQSQVED